MIHIIAVLLVLRGCLCAPLWNNETFPVYHLGIPIVEHPIQALSVEGLVYIQETGEICTDDTTSPTASSLWPKLGRGKKDKHELDDDKGTKYCISELSNTRAMPRLDMKAPVTPCLDSTNGDGGSTSRGFSVSVSLSLSVSLGLAMPILDLINLSTGYSAGVSVGYSLSFSCSASAGDTIQMWATPIVGLTDLRYREYKSGEAGNADSKYIKDFQFPVGGLQPAVECLSGTYVNCREMTVDNFILENPML